MRRRGSGEGRPGQRPYPQVQELWYEPEDLLYLLEIAAVAEQNPQSVSIDGVLWEEACASYHATGDEEETRQKLQAMYQYFSYRYAEWLLVRALLQGLDLAGKSVLDLGAGHGFDTWRLLHRGAKVTALEPNPFLAASGFRNFSEALWIGGFSHVLPFRSQSFDLVYSNAALHHMRDIPAALEESLRVLRPGGYLITTCDSCRGDHLGEEVELRIFNDHQDVLLGVNERIPAQEEFLSALLKYKDALEIQVATSNMDSESDGLGVPLSYHALWEIDDLPGLSSASLALRVRLRRPVKPAGRLQKSFFLQPAHYVSLCEDVPRAIASLARSIPERYVNLTIPHPFHDKFLLLNGWRLPGESNPEWQEGFGRGCWFLRRSPEDVQLVLEIEIIETMLGASSEVRFLLNGEVALTASLPRGIWHRISLPVAHITAGETFCLRMDVSGGLGFSERIFRVRNRHFKTSGDDGEILTAELGSTAGLQALLTCNFPHRHSLTVLFLPGQTNVFNFLRHLRAHGVQEIKAIVPEQQRWIFAMEDRVKVIAAYPLTLQGASQTLAMGPDLAVISTEIWPQNQILKQLIEANIPIVNVVTDRLVSTVPSTPIMEQDLRNLLPPKIKTLLKRLLHKCSLWNLLQKFGRAS
jgi:SAM-dependent methyltransferase